MFGGLIVYGAMLVLSVIGRAGIESVAMVLVITGAIPVLAIATVSALEAGQSRRVWRGASRSHWGTGHDQRRRTDVRRMLRRRTRRAQLMGMRRPPVRGTLLRPPSRGVTRAQLVSQRVC